jgi:salicylate hydroxylase
LRWARDASMTLLGEKLLDMPWLYGAVPRDL